MPQSRSLAAEVDTFGIGVLTPRPPEDVRAAQVAVAVATTELPELTCDEEREEVLVELLLMLGIYYRTTDPVVKVSAHGTVAGYWAHIKAYHTPCNPCTEARLREQDERWRDLGIPDGEVVIPV